jgi:hypothetical protein
MERDGSEPTRNWKRHFAVRRESVKTTWKLRVAILLCVVLLVFFTRGRWISAIGRSVVCQEQLERSEVILVENFDQQYLPFERAAELLKKGVAARVVIPTKMGGDAAGFDLISEEIVRLMARVAQLPPVEMIPIRETEPISLNAAYQIRDFLQHQHVRSVLVVAPALRSKRSSLVYEAVLGQVGIATRCAPVLGAETVASWTASWHGIQQVAEQYAKLQYYRYYVLPHLLQRGRQIG